MHVNKRCRLVALGSDGMEGKDSTSTSLTGGFGSATSKRLVSDASALVDLKAEVFRKYQEAKFNKLHGKSSEGKVTRTESNKNAIWSKQTAGRKKTAAATKRPDLRDGDDEEREKEARVRDALTRKADMYDRMKKGKDTDHSSRFLVQFKNNDDSDEDDGDDDWVEYKDALGRTRVCRKGELPELVKQDKDLEEYENERGRGRADEDEAALQTDLLSEDMRREMLRQKWEREEEENLRKRDVHYQDMLFDEARTHGAGFYRFAKDEVARAAQRENLDQLHEETEKQRQHRTRLQNKRQAKLKDRLKKVRDRKRLKMGLPLAESESDEDKVEEAAGREESDEDSDVDTEKNIVQGLRAMREQEERQREAKRKAAVREWDLGKEGVVAGEKFVLSQKEWVSEKRRERQNEFAPPSAYAAGNKSKANYGAPSASATTTSSQASSSKMHDFSRPPPSFAANAPKSSSYANRVEEIKESSGPKQDPMRSLDIVGPRPREENSSNDSASDSEEQQLEPISLSDRLKLYRDSATSKIPATMSDDDDDDDDDVGPRQPSRGAEVGPPCDMNYYVTQSSRGPPNRMGVRTHEDLAEAISFGIQQNNAKAKAAKECSDSDSE